MKKLTVISCLFFAFGSYAQVTISIDFKQPTTPISPYIYGANNIISISPGNATNEEQWTRLLESGMRIVRQNGGNNATKYNWRKKISSHPDWYNNVYGANWDFAIQSLVARTNRISALFAFQLLGKAANDRSSNFNDWGFNRSAYWEGTGQNLAGGGTVNVAGGINALAEGNPSLYTKNWPADSSTSILDYWRKTPLNIPDEFIRFWNMDNEPEIWDLTHNDIVKQAQEPEFYIQKYVEVALSAKKRFPGIQLVGPASPNEWQWYNWQKATYLKGNRVCWLEYFIAKIAEEQKKHNQKLLDVLDIHFYPGSTNPTNIVQYHRVFFDSTYVYPEANGVKGVNGGWDNNIKTEKIFLRCQEWLNKYMGANHGVRFGISETNSNTKDANVNGIWYASNLGEWMRHPEMVLFTPWTWKVGMWETVHLFSRYSHGNYVPSVSSNEVLVSAYASINYQKDSASVILVNRDIQNERQLQLDIRNVSIRANEANVRLIHNLPANETFVSHTQNAIKVSKSTISNGKLTLTLPPLSIASIELPLSKIVTSVENEDLLSTGFHVSPCPAHDVLTIDGCEPNEAFELVDIAGRTHQTFISEYRNAKVDITQLYPGLYFIISKNSVSKKKVKFIKE